MQSLVSSIEINCIGTNGETATYKACKAGRADVVQFLASQGADVNIANSQRWFPINVAAENGHMKVLQVLAAHGANFGNVNCIGTNGETATYKASKAGHADVVQFLANQGADVNIANNQGWFPINVAAENGHIEVLQVLAAHGANFGNVNCIGTNGETATYKASKAGHADVVQFLANQGADVNIANCQGVYPIDIAAEKVHVEMLDVLAAHGAILENPLLMMAKTKKLDAVVALLNVGADVSIKDSNGKTCLDQFPAKDKLAILTTVHYNLSLFEAHNYALWFVVVQEDGTSDVDLFANLSAKVKTLVSNHPTLAAAKDADGRAAVDVASKPMKLIMQSVLLWHGRYRITEPRPEHISATCFVFKGVDEHTIDKETSQPMKVALKLMRLKDQFQREISTRAKELNKEHVMHILQTHPEVGSSTFDSWPDEVMDIEADATGQLTKTNAEKLFLLVMPLADRNLFVALKQERWAGKNMEEVRHVFVQLVHCVEHMHEKGVLHADLKTLNIVRTAGQWKLIDLDAACGIGKEPVGHKSSSAYVPPEAIYVDEKTDSACVRSVVAVTKGEANYELLTAHPSFDVWSLGCILYQMCTADVKPLFQGGQDDNLTDDQTEEDSLFALAKWSHWKKAKKLLHVDNLSARNLLGQMLHKDPLQRPTLARVLGHPFLSGRQVARLIGEKPKYDVFLSYRVASDTQHVEKLYNLLTAQGFEVYWDKFCLLPGVDWEQGFCEGLVSSRAFVPLLSRDAINHPDKDCQNFSKLTLDSKCDNVFLEHRLAVELQGLGLIEKMFPVFIGSYDATTSEYSDYFGSGCHPSLSEVAVKSVEKKLRYHMESQALGTPMVPDRTVKSVVDAITACQGASIVGPANATFAAAAASIAKMLTDVPNSQSPYGTTHVHQTLLNTMDNKTLVAENSTLKSEVGILTGKIDSLVGKNGTLKNDNGTMKSDNSTLVGENGVLKGENVILKSENSTLVGQREIALASLRSGQFASVEAVIAHMEALLQG